MPAQRIGSNQVIGYVQIESEELSDLQEKSARDGLKENDAFKRLKKITLEQVIAKLEERRFIYRRRAGLSRPAPKVEPELQKLFNFDDIKDDVARQLSKLSIDRSFAEKIVRTIAKKEEDSNRIAEDIRRAVAIYQGHATLGKIINVILHEGRKPLNYFKSQIPNLFFWVEDFKIEEADQYLEEILPIAKGVAENAQILVNLFSRLDPLAAAKRKPKDFFDLRKEVLQSFDVFESEMIDNKITKDIARSAEKIAIWGWSNDIRLIMTNLIENSIYWIVEKNCQTRKIEVSFESKDGRFEAMNYRDSGPGIENHLIESGVIFEPDFTTKNQGTGLGLAIAGEAASRNNLELRALESDTGAHFRLQPAAEGD
jgi:C4-dicarboxylate-specific signal transduction histidine kinase